MIATTSTTWTLRGVVGGGHVDPQTDATPGTVDRATAEGLSPHGLEDDTRVEHVRAGTES